MNIRTALWKVQGLGVSDRYVEVFLSKTVDTTILAFRRRAALFLSRVRILSGRCQLTALRQWKPRLISLAFVLFTLFHVNSAQAANPTISSLSPTSGAVGAAVTITGTNFGSSQGSSTVNFNGTIATITTWSATSSAVTVPTGAKPVNVSD